MRFELRLVEFMPKQLEPGLLYVSEQYGAAAHLCACGCGSKIRTPLGPTEWELEKTSAGPTLMPSIGNWQLACQSHYWIERGEVIWARKWTPDEIAAGRRDEARRADAYYSSMRHDRPAMVGRLWLWIKRLFSSPR
jgi:hypothetical protein